MSKKKKKKREKITYIDDGSTVADMSALNKSRGKSGTAPKRRSTMKEQFGTYKQSVKMMFVPMLVTLAGITVIFLILYLILTIAEMNL